jgi:hypothetical protein
MNAYFMWLYHRFSFNRRAVEDLLAVRPVRMSREAMSKEAMSNETIRQWCGIFSVQFARRIEASVKMVHSQLFCANRAGGRRVVHSVAAS